MEELSCIAFLLLRSFSQPQSVVLIPWRWWQTFRRKAGRHWWLNQLTMCVAVKLLFFFFFLLRSLDLCPSSSQSLTHLLHLTAQRAEPQLDPEPLSSVCQNVSHIKDKPWLPATYYRSWGLFPDQTLNGCAWHGWGQENTNSSCHLWLRLRLNIRTPLHRETALQDKNNPVNHLYKQLITTCNYIFFLI